MRLALLFLLGTTLAACAGTRPEADPDLPPQYAAAPTVADPSPYGVDVEPTGDAALDALLRQVAAAFERHDWRALAYTLDAEAFAEQFAFMHGDGRTPEAAVSQVLEETFGLGTVGNQIFPEALDREARSFAGLDRVRSFSLESAEAAGEGRWQVEGSVRLDDRTSRRLSFTVIRTGDAYRVAVPMG